MIHLVYKTTNLINGKFYIGVHSTESINDSYLGSGRLITRAIAKYGRENFKREIVAQFHSRKEAYECERVLLTEDLIKSGKCYNLAPGGHGGDVTQHLSSNRKIQIAICKRSAQLKRYSDPKQRARVSQVHLGAKRDEQTKINMSAAQLNAWADVKLRAKQSEIVKNRMKDPVLRARLSAAAKARYAR